MNTDMNPRSSRDMMIERLIQDDLNSIMYDGVTAVFRYVLKHGFEGYDNMSDEHLELEYNSREYPD